MTCARTPIGLLVAAGLFAGCAGEREVTVEQKSYGDPLLDKYAGNFRYEKSDDGSTRIVSEQRSEFEGAHAQGWGKDFSTRRFATTERAREPWWGKQGYSATKAWDGGKTANEAGSQSRLGALHAHDAGKAAPGTSNRYDTGTFATRRAREHSSKRLAKTPDALTAGKRETYPAPYVIGWEKQRELSVEQIKGILGRGN